MWIFYAILSAVFAALVAIFGKLGLKGIDPTFATALRSGVMFVFVLATSIVAGKIQFSSLNKNTLTYILLSGIAGALSWIFYFIALKDGDASKVTAIDRLSVIFVVFLAAMFSLEQLSVIKVAGAILIAIGAVLIVK